MFVGGDGVILVVYPASTRVSKTIKKVNTREPGFRWPYLAATTLKDVPIAKRRKTG